MFVLEGEEEGDGERVRERLNHNEHPGLSLDSSPLEALREFRGRV